MIGAMYSGPGPAQYALPGCTGSSNLDVRMTHVPSYTMRPQLTQSFGGPKSPGPGVYAIPSGQFRDGSFKGSEYTMRIKPKDLKGNGQAPGPGKYAPELLNTLGHSKTKEEAPAYTMRARTYQPLSGTSTPGPKYNIRGQTGKGKKAVTGGTFGSRHSQYTYIVCE